MSDIMTPIPFGKMMNWILEEHKKGAIFGIRRPFVADQSKKYEIFGRTLETPFGPAAGPHTQLTQNIVAAYVAGSRFFELKTVQKLDGEDLPVAKPCIKADDECYNCEWSTELYVPQAYDEYVKAWFACKVLAKEYGLGSMDGFQFNMSVGYDLDGIKLEKVDIVAVEAAPGHDIGVVTLTGRLVPLQMKKANFKADAEIKRIYRKAKPVDMEKFNEAKDKEHATMIRARQIALNLNLNMKIGDVEYQGDGNKAIFYYIADERVDFRQLIKVLAEAFRVRIEMKQIGARQEAGRIGGIGPCGRELCCATWMTSFVSVSTSAARFQDISLNPQKLAGQCAKLKCCLNYEVDCYVEAQKRLPSKEIELETKEGTFYFFKADILSNQVSYSTDKNFPANLVTISGKRAFEVIGMNKKGMKPDSLLEEERKAEPKKPIDLLEQESVTRFDRSRNNSKEGNNANRNKKKKKGTPNNRPQQQVEGTNRPQQPQRENEGRPQPAENGNRGDRENRPRNNNNNRNRGQNQGRNNENRRPERRQERPQNQERPQGQERERPARPEPRPERNPNQAKPQNNEKPSQE